MTKQISKKKSKRISTRKRTKIERKVREHNRKTKKNLKNNPLKGKRKDPGIPNSIPYKDQILKEAEDRKKRLEEERQMQKEKAKKERAKLRNKNRNLEQFVTDAQKRTAEFDKKSELQSAEKQSNQQNAEGSLKAYYKEFRKVVDDADVIFQVLDARDPLGSRCPQVEEAVLACGYKKRLVLLLNKIDLVPKENVEKWLKYLRNEFPTIAFKASTQTQTDNLSQSRISVAKATEDLLRSSRCIGADMVMKLLGNYCRNQAVRGTITAGVVGFPNTGKSSIINSLKRSRACNVGATPGVTKCMQLVQLDKHVKLLDSPGIVMATGDNEASVILRNAVKVETIDDTVAPVSAILKRCNKHQMMLHYNVPYFNDVNEFLALLAVRLGRLKKGGIPDVHKAGRSILNDWNQGKITYYTHPPDTDAMATHVSSEIVSQMSEGFDISSLLEQETEILAGLKMKNCTDIVLEASNPTDGLVAEPAEVEEEDEGDMEDENQEGLEDNNNEQNMVVTLPESEKPKKETSVKSKAKNVRISADKKVHVVGSLRDGVQLNKARKKDLKKMKKERRRADKLGGELGDALQDAFASLGNTKDTAEDYNFDTDFGLK